MSTENTTIEINTQKRTAGKHDSRALRKNLMVPSVVYGNNLENKNISISFNDANKCISHKHNNTIFTLKSDDDSSLNGLQVIRRQLDVHPVSRRPVHIDFYAPDFNKKKKFKVVIEFFGKPKGVSLGGFLTIYKREVELECIPALAPKTLKIDLAPLDIGQKFKASDVDAGDNVTVISDPEEILAKVDTTKG